MKKTFLNKIITLVLAVIFFSGFCFFALGMQNGTMGMSVHTQSKTVMPCCGENSDHFSVLDIPAARQFILLLTFFAVILISVAVKTSTGSEFSTFSYAFLAPPGPDLLLKIIKRE